MIHPITSCLGHAGRDLRVHVGRLRSRQQVDGAAAGLVAGQRGVVLQRRPGGRRGSLRAQAAA